MEEIFLSKKWKAINLTLFIIAILVSYYYFPIQFCKNLDANNISYIKVNDLNNAFQNTSRMLKRSLNEEKLGKNVHNDCEYYNQETDTCYNFLMGKYSGLAFEVSRYDKCIKDII